MGKIIALLVTAAIIVVQASANCHEDGNSMAEMASLMKENFRDLFKRLHRLESKMNRITGKETCQLGETGSGGEILNEDSLDGFHEESGTVTTPGSIESHFETSTKEVNRLHSIISERECFFQSFIQFP